VCDSISGSDELGLTRVVDFVSLLKKPIITHNGILDLMFLYDKFFETLPQDVNKFR
jgi:hypothetical protein